MKLSAWHSCKNYWKKGWNCPLAGIKDHEDDDEEEDIKRPREWADAKEFNDFIYIAHRRRDEVRQAAKIIKFPTERIRDSPPPEYKEPPIAAIVPDANPNPFNESKEALKPWVPNPVHLQAARQAVGRPAVVTAPAKVKEPSTQRQTAKVSEPTRVPTRVPSSSGSYVMGKAEQTFASSLPKPSATPRSSGVQGKAERESAWGRKAAGAAVAATAATGAYAIYKSGGGGRGRGGNIGRSAAFDLTPKGAALAR